MEVQKEEVRIKTEYMRDTNANVKSISRMPYAMFFDYARFAKHSRENAMMDVLWQLKLDIPNMASLKFFDMGCGDGNVLRDFISYGATPWNCYGIDLIQQRVWTAKDRSFGAHFTCGNAMSTPHQSKTFNVVLLFTMLSAMLNKDMQKEVIKEAKRVCSDDGIILIYDMNDGINNDHICGINIEELKKQFDGYDVVVSEILPKVSPQNGHKSEYYDELYKKQMNKENLLCFVLGATRRKSENTAVGN